MLSTAKVMIARIDTAASLLSADRHCRFAVVIFPSWRALRQRSCRDLKLPMQAVRMQPDRRGLLLCGGPWICFGRSEEASSTNDNEIRRGRPEMRKILLGRIRRRPDANHREGEDQFDGTNILVRQREHSHIAVIED
jgi:hypothetical protein